MKADYLPDAGDLIWVTFDPQAGKEQAGRRPALVLSPKSYNARAGLALVCPITSHVKGYPIEVRVHEAGGSGVAGGVAGGMDGVILADHLKSIDWRARRAELAGRCPATSLDETRAKIAPLLGI